MGRSQYSARVKMGEEFVRAYHDQVVDLEVRFDLRVETRVFLSTRKGVLVVTMSAHEPQAPPCAASKARVVGEYPNATAQALEAFLYSQSHKLYVMCEAMRREERERKAV